MNSAKRLSAGILAGVWGVLALSAGAVAQEYSAEPVPSGTLSRAEWEQRMVQTPPQTQAVRPQYTRSDNNGYNNGNNVVYSNGSKVTSNNGNNAVYTDKYGNRYTLVPQQPQQQRRVVRSTAQPVAYVAGDEPAGKPLSPIPDKSSTIQGRMEARPVPMDAVPMEGVPMSPQGMPMGRQGMPMDPGVPMGEPYADGNGCSDGCPNGCGGGGEEFCDEGCCGCCLLQSLAPWLQHFSLSTGVHGYKGPMDNGEAGNFGIQEGAEVAGPLGEILGEGVQNIGYDVGLELTQSNFRGAVLPGPGADHNQDFITAGLFRRAACTGWQWAAAFDLLHDNYYAQTDLKQLRAELSYATGGTIDIGFWGAFNTGGSQPIAQSATTTYTIAPLNMYTGFIRKYFEEGGEGQFWAGVTETHDTVLGVDLKVPMGYSWALENDFLCMIPAQGPSGVTPTGETGQNRETWSVSINLVWYPARSARSCQDDPFRPMLPVADNSHFIVDRK